jgi:hypothetical protein
MVAQCSRSVRRKRFNRRKYSLWGTVVTCGVREQLSTETGRNSMLQYIVTQWGLFTVQ